MKPLQPRRRFHRFSTVELLVALALLFFFFPFVEEVKGGDVIISILLSLVLLSAVLAVADRKGVFFIALVLAIPAIAGRWINHFRPDLVPPPVFLIAGLVLGCFRGGEFAPLRFACAFGKHRSPLREHLGLPDAWLDVDNSLLARGPGDSKCLRVQHGQRDKTDRWTGFNAFYFSFITLSTVGYGDITPVSRIARWLAATEAMTGLALCHRFDCPPGFTLIPLQSLNDSCDVSEGGGILHFAIDRMELSAVDFIKTLGVSFAALFPIVNPVGDAPIFFGLTQNYPQSAQKVLARKIAAYGFVLLVVSALFGSEILAFFGISLFVVQIAGGLVVAATGWKLLNQPDDDSSSKQVPETLEDALQHAFFPLTLPLTVGPGAISVAITLGAHLRYQAGPGFEHGYPRHFIAAAAGMLLVCLLVVVCYGNAARLVGLLGKSGTSILTRLSAFILLAIGVQIFWNGLSVGILQMLAHTTAAH